MDEAEFRQTFRDQFGSLYPLALGIFRKYGGENSDCVAGILFQASPEERKGVLKELERLYDNISLQLCSSGMVPAIDRIKNLNRVLRLPPEAVDKVLALADGEEPSHQKPKDHPNPHRMRKLAREAREAKKARHDKKSVELFDELFDELHETGQEPAPA